MHSRRRGRNRKKAAINRWNRSSNQAPSSTKLPERCIARCFAHHANRYLAVIRTKHIFSTDFRSTSVESLLDGLKNQRALGFKFSMVETSGTMIFPFGCTPVAMYASIIAFTIAFVCITVILVREYRPERHVSPSSGSFPFWLRTSLKRP